MPPSSSAARRSARRPTANALWAGLADGVIDLVVTDHSPCTPELKRFDVGDFGLAWGGIAGLQVGLSAVWTQARRRGFALADVVRWMARRPADLVGLPAKGRIAPGADADLCAFAPDAEFTVDAAAIAPPQPGQRLPRQHADRRRSRHLAAWRPRHRDAAERSTAEQGRCMTGLVPTARPGVPAARRRSARVQRRVLRRAGEPDPTAATRVPAEHVHQQGPGVRRLGDPPQSVANPRPRLGDHPAGHARGSCTPSSWTPRSSPGTTHRSRPSRACSVDGYPSPDECWRRSGPRSCHAPPWPATRRMCSQWTVLIGTRTCGCGSTRTAAWPGCGCTARRCPTRPG